MTMNSLGITKGCCHSDSKVMLSGTSAFQVTQSTVIYSLTVIETETEIQIISLIETKTETEMFSKTETKYKRKSERTKLNSN